MRRKELLRSVAALIDARPRAPVLLVAIDGVDGAGKTVFAEELAPFLGSPVMRASIDGFHNPRSVRYARGKASPEGFYFDSFNLAELRNALLDPLRPGGSGLYRTAAFDHRTDAPIDLPTLSAQSGSVLLFDGIFLHRPELRDIWDFSVFLDVDREETLRRCLAREGIEGISSDPSDPVHARYVQGQEIYLKACNPKEQATIVIDNNDLERPFLVSTGEK